MTRPARTYSWIDRVIIEFDQALRTISPGATTSQPSSGRPSPATSVDETDLTQEERQRSASMMRINHAGEVCAQALYSGQALSARGEQVRLDLQRAANEEIDHLRWCQQRLQQLDSHTSALNPLWYTASFAIGVAAGAAGDKINLGFIAATEEQVGHHLREHLQKLPPSDHKSRAIVEQMLVDETQHADQALAAGGGHFPRWFKQGMRWVAKIMTTLSARY